MTTETTSPDAAQMSALTLEVDGLRYEVDRAPARDGRKVCLVVRHGSEEGTRSFFDRADLYAFRSRQVLASLVAEQFGREAGAVLGHLALLLDQIERASTAEKKTATVVITAPRRAAAEKLLASKDLLDRAAKALDALGYVGEEENKRLVYLVATSRLLARPLAATLCAESGTGKSELLDRVAQLMPPEQVELLSRATPQALHYVGAQQLRHKLVIVDERAGTAESDHAVRAPAKKKAESSEAHAPAAVLSGTTWDDRSPENHSRGLELKLDASAEQTKRVQSAQRIACSGGAGRTVDVELFRDAQRLLEPAEVVIPFATRLTFPARTTGDRRNNMKLLTLVMSHALLHQRQRDRDERDRIVATVADYRAVHALLAPLVRSELDDLSPRAATLYRALLTLHEPVSRRDAAKLLGWGYNTVKRALGELLAHELVQVVAKRMPRLYELADDSLGGAALALTDPSDL